MSWRLCGGADFLKLFNWYILWDESRGSRSGLQVWGLCVGLRDKPGIRSKSCLSLIVSHQFGDTGLLGIRHRAPWNTLLRMHSNRQDVFQNLHGPFPGKHWWLRSGRTPRIVRRVQIVAWHPERHVNALKERVAHAPWCRYGTWERVKARSLGSGTRVNVPRQAGVAMWWRMSTRFDERSGTSISKPQSLSFDLFQVPSSARWEYTYKYIHI